MLLYIRENVTLTMAKKKKKNEFTIGAECNWDGQVKVADRTLP